MIMQKKEGYYSSKRIDFEDNNGHYIEKGFIVRYLVFLDNENFICTDWKNKESFNLSDLSSIERGGKYFVKDNSILLKYKYGGYVENCDIVNEKMLIHNFNNPGTKLIFQKWGNKFCTTLKSIINS